MGAAAKIKLMIEKKSPILKIACKLYNHIPFGNKFQIRGGSCSLDFTFIRKTKFKYRGKNNIISILPGSRLNNCNIIVLGSNNKITIGKFCSLNNVELWIEDNNNEIFIGDHTSFAGATHLACIEGQKIKIGNDCMFSANITVRTGDSHSVTNLDGVRINRSKSVLIGNHVWVGNTVIITKGVTVGDNCVIGTGSVVTRKFEQNNVAIAGNSAKVVKEGISWDRKRLPIEQ